MTHETRPAVLDLIGNTPLLRVTRLDTGPCTLYLKLESQNPGRSIKDVAAKSGYHSPWQLSQQMREMTGRTTEQVRRELDGEALVLLLAEQVRRRRRKDARGWQQKPGASREERRGQIAPRE